NSESLGKVFRGVGLRIPRPEMKHILAALGPWFVKVGVGYGERAEQLALPSSEVYAKGRIQRMSCFVSQDAHAFIVRAALDLEHLLALEFHQSRMGEIERNSNAGDPVG